MSIVAIEMLEDCFDGSSVYAYTMDSPWTRAMILGMNGWGNLDYFPDFPRPFFRLCTPKGMQLKGIEGDVTCRVIFPSCDKATIKEAFEQRLNSLAR